MWKLKQCGQTVRNSNNAVCCIDTYQVKVVRIIQMNWSKRSLIKIKQKLASVATVFNTSFKHSIFRRTSVGNAKTKLPENRSLDNDCSQLLENFASVSFQRINSFKLNLPLWFRQFNWKFDSFDKNFETKWANFQRFKRRCFFYSFRSSNHC